MGYGPRHSHQLVGTVPSISAVLKHVVWVIENGDNRSKHTAVMWLHKGSLLAGRVVYLTSLFDIFGSINVNIGTGAASRGLPFLPSYSLRSSL